MLRRACKLDGDDVPGRESPCNPAEADSCRESHCIRREWVLCTPQTLWSKDTNPRKERCLCDACQVEKKSCRNRHECCGCRVGEVSLRRVGRRLVDKDRKKTRSEGYQELAPVQNDDEVAGRVRAGLP